MKRRLIGLLALCMVVTLIPHGVMTTARGAQEGNTIAYLTGKEESLRFVPEDFEALCRKATGEKLDWIRFTPPQDRQGTLWMRYGLTGQQKSPKEREYDTKDLAYVAFTPAQNWVGSLSIGFDGRSRNGGSFSGAVEVTVDGYPGDLIYYLDGEYACTLVAEDLDQLCRQTTGRGLESIRFPKVERGNFYQDRGSPDWVFVKPTTTYYPDKEPKLERLSFVGAPYGPEEWVLEFSATASGGKEFEGKIRFRSSENPRGSISRKGTAGESVSLDNGELDRDIKKLAGEGWKSIRFDRVKAQVGALYYDYHGAGQKKLDGQSLSPRELQEVSFVPASKKLGVVQIDFTVMDAQNKEKNGTLTITCGEPEPVKTVYYTTGVQPVVLDQNGGITGRYTLPDPKAGKLWNSYAVPTQYSGGTMNADGTFGAGQDEPGVVSFVPKAGFTGEVVIRMQGEKGGKIVIQVHPDNTQGIFTDLPQGGQMTQGAEFLYRQGVVKGTSQTTFSPQQDISRADFLLMLARAYGFTQPAGAGEGFPDVAPQAYYASAVMAARELGVAKGDEKGNFNPLDPVTRRDAATLVSRVLEGSGQTMSQGDLEKILPWDSQAAAGNLTRGEMAVLLHRVLTL